MRNEFRTKPTYYKIHALTWHAMHCQIPTIDLAWGEQWIQIERLPNGIYMGTGRIGKTSGDDLARQFNEQHASTANGWIR